MQGKSDLIHTLDKHTETVAGKGFLSLRFYEASETYARHSRGGRHVHRVGWCMGERSHRSKLLSFSTPESISQTLWQFIQQLSRACEALHELPASVDEIAIFNVGLLKWDPLSHPWFPCISSEGAERRRNRRTT